MHGHLGIFVALATAFTVIVIASSYSQIVELFPGGGGGYLVASKLLTPTLGMISGCALLIDYVLTITLSIASGADAIFSFLPIPLLRYKLIVAVLGVLLLMVLNLRGVRESVMPLVPIFLLFLVTHTFAIFYALLTHIPSIGEVAQTTIVQTRAARQSLGGFGVFLLLMRAYSMGAGTYTGIEAVSNGLPILREPRVQTAKRTMRYMAASLAFMAAGLMIGYLLFGVTKVPGRTLNAVLMERIASGWGVPGSLFVLLTLISEAVLLFVAAQAGFLDGPRVLANMSLDRWLPGRIQPPERTSGHQERDRPDGRGRPRSHAGEQWLGQFPHRPLCNQRFHHVLPFPGRHGAPLVERARPRHGVEAQVPDQRHRPARPDGIGYSSRCAPFDARQT